MPGPTPATQIGTGQPTRLIYQVDATNADGLALAAALRVLDPIGFPFLQAVRDAAVVPTEDGGWTVWEPPRFPYWIDENYTFNDAGLRQFDSSDNPVSLNLQLSFVVGDPHPESPENELGYGGFDGTDFFIILNNAVGVSYPGWDDMNAVHDVVAHELGHILQKLYEERYSTTQFRDALRDIFEAPSAQLSTGPWVDRLEEGFAETFKDVYLKDEHRKYDNRTNHRLSEDRFQDFLDLIQELWADFEWVHESVKYEMDSYVGTLPPPTPTNAAGFVLLGDVSNPASVTVNARFMVRNLLPGVPGGDAAAEFGFYAEWDTGDGYGPDYETFTPGPGEDIYNRDGTLGVDQFFVREKDWTIPVPDGATTLWLMRDSNVSPNPAVDFWVDAEDMISEVQPQPTVFPPYPTYAVAPAVSTIVVTGAQQGLHRPRHRLVGGIR
jgi:hypothetical protein